MTVTLHKILMHGADIVNSTTLSVGMLSDIRYGYMVPRCLGINVGEGIKSTIIEKWIP